MKSKIQSNLNKRNDNSLEISMTSNNKLMKSSRREQIIKDSFNKPKTYIQNEKNSPKPSSHYEYDFYLANLKKEKTK